MDGRQRFNATAIIDFLGETTMADNERFSSGGAAQLYEQNVVPTNIRPPYQCRLRSHVSA